MRPIHHRYTSHKLFEMNAILCNVMGLIAPLLIIGYPLSEAIFTKKTITIEGFLSYFLLGTMISVACILRGNFRCDIISDEDGLYVWFLWTRRFVPWKDITELKPLFNTYFFKNAVVLRTRSLTIFHRLYGLLYSFSLQPSIVITKDISGYDELFQRIKTALKNNR